MRPLILSLIVLGGCPKKDAAPESLPSHASASGLVVADVTPGTGDPAKAGDTVTVHYVGALQDGTTFDSSRERDLPFVFKLGEGRVIKGWDEGLLGMKVGGVRRLIIPPELGYASRATGSIPANSTLLFEIELLALDAGRSPPEHPHDPAGLVWQQQLSGVRWADLNDCSGEPVQTLQVVHVEYTGWLADGTRFDSSLMRERPFDFVVGAHQVIAGWEEAVAAMPVGCARQIAIPADQGYGQRGSPPVIPPGTDLVFEVEVLGADAPRVAPEKPAVVEFYQTLGSGLRLAELEVGSGAEATDGATVAVDYSAWLSDGTRFDSSLTRSAPLSFVLGSGRVIRGWEEGIRGMRVGGRRQLIIPPHLAYGEDGRPPVIPESATLVFDVRLIDVRP